MKQLIFISHEDFDRLDVLLPTRSLAEKKIEPLLLIAYEESFYLRQKQKAWTSQVSQYKTEISGYHFTQEQARKQRGTDEVSEETEFTLENAQDRNLRTDSPALLQLSL